MALKELQRMTAKDLMKTDVVVATEDMTVSELSSLLEEKRVSGVPVVDGLGKVIGVVSERDIVRLDAEAVEDKAEEMHPFFRRDWTEGQAVPESINFELPDVSRDVFVGTIMTPAIISVLEEDPVGEAAKRMIEEHVHRVLVVDKDYHLKGVISSWDIVNAIYKQFQKESASFKEGVQQSLKKEGDHG